MAGNAQVAQRMLRAATLMRQHGLTVGAFSGWADAGRSSTMNPRAVLAHHTGAEIDVDRILRDGRPDLAGPLCNWALHKDGSWWLVASGRANHAGEGVLPSSESYGIEATGPIPLTNAGKDAFPQYQSYVIGVACILHAEGWAPTTIFGHRETARPCGRKPDPAFGGVTLANCVSSSMNAFRSDVATFMREGGSLDMPLTNDDLPIIRKALAQVLGLSGEDARMQTIQFGQVNNDRAWNILATRLEDLKKQVSDLPVGATPVVDAAAVAAALAKNTEFLSAVAKAAAQESGRRLSAPV